MPDNPHLNGHAAHNDASAGSTAESDFKVICRRVNERINAFLLSDAPSKRLKTVQNQTRISLDVIREALTLYRLDEVSLSYNGGKDCLVLLILFLAALYEIPSFRSSPSSHLQSVYIVSPHPFKEVDDFVEHSISTYHLNLARYAKPMKEAFADYLHDHPSVKAIMVGTRRTDPHGAELKHFDPTDRGWPTFMRVHPVIDWHYAEIWAFIRHLEIPYCPLYDRGYTSLGGTTDTHPNPSLRLNSATENEVEASSKTHFRPAYELVADDDERLGRDK